MSLSRLRAAGLLDAREYEEITFEAKPGDTMVLYSDGITDHMSAAGVEYGRGRLAQVVRRHCNGPASDLIDAIFAELDRYSTTAFDDQTVERLFAIGAEKKVMNSRPRLGIEHSLFRILVVFG